MIRSICISIVLVLLIQTVIADPIDVPNYSFELDLTGLRRGAVMKEPWIDVREHSCAGCQPVDSSHAYSWYLA